MKKLTTFLLSIIILLSCNKGVRDRNKFIGKWEMTEYNSDGIVIDEKEAFTSVTMEIKHQGYLTSTSSEVYRSENPCDHSYPIGVSFNETSINFGEFSVCDTLNKIDPYFYETTDTSNNGLSGRWNIEYHNKRILILNNNGKAGKASVRILFEKSI